MQRNGPQGIEHQVQPVPDRSQWGPRNGRKTHSRGIIPNRVRKISGDRAPLAFSFTNHSLRLPQSLWYSSGVGVVAGKDKPVHRPRAGANNLVFRGKSVNIWP
ncbi:hypothetical protein GOODEAATRI_019647 [Goodea atripinnis]|uniref:Uncharacterized protein n=1 Tax=Goodea atripinnis TaxID=208336 RepID=A0ABV0NLL0_9TELE